MALTTLEKLQWDAALMLIDGIWKYHKQTRAMFPSIENVYTPKKIICPPPFYNEIVEEFGTRWAIVFEKELDARQQITLQAIAYILNQNFVVRLYSILQSIGAVTGCEYKDIDHSLKGDNIVNIIRRLRNVYAHELGYINHGTESFKHDRRRQDRVNRKEDPNDHYAILDLMAKHLESPEYLERKNQKHSLAPYTLSDQFPIEIDKVLQRFVEASKVYVNSYFLRKYPGESPYDQIE